MAKVLAFDFGASSGRAIVGELCNEVLKIEEVHRFSNDPVLVNGHFYWDVLRLYHEIKQGITKCVTGNHADIASLGIDTWGVDFGLVDEDGNLVQNPHHYRDPRTNGVMQQAFEVVSKELIYKNTGIQILPFNTIFQLISMANSGAMQCARKLLLVPDIFNYFLTGQMCTEYTNATTTQLFDTAKLEWSRELIQKFGIKEDLFTDIVYPGSVCGTIKKEVCDELGVAALPVISVASHDTASAVASVPAKTRDFMYISSGTFSLMGMELDQPLINDQAMHHNFTNEGGVCNTTRFLKNIMGLWIVQECRRQWIREGDDVSFSALENMAGDSSPFACFIDPDNQAFVEPGNMPTRIAQFCRDTGQHVPSSKGEIVRCIMESLALKYKCTANIIQRLVGKNVNSINIVGGGTKDSMLCQFTANATAKTVVAGPVEATAIGNIVVQLMALGEIADIWHARKIIRSSFDVKTYAPQNCAEWDVAYERFLNIVQ